MNNINYKNKYLKYKKKYLLLKNQIAGNPNTLLTIETTVELKSILLAINLEFEGKKDIELIAVLFNNMLEVYDKLNIDNDFANGLSSSTGKEVILEFAKKPEFNMSFYGLFWTFLINVGILNNESLNAFVGKSIGARKGLYELLCVYGLKCDNDKVTPEKAEAIKKIRKQLPPPKTTAPKPTTKPKPKPKPKEKVEYWEYDDEDESLAAYRAHNAAYSAW